MIENKTVVPAPSVVLQIDAPVPPIMNSFQDYSENDVNRQYILFNLLNIKNWVEKSYNSSARNELFPSNTFLK